jgi:hypothetical protein
MTDQHGLGVPGGGVCGQLFGLHWLELSIDEFDLVTGIEEGSTEG